MFTNSEELKVVRLGRNISFSSLEQIANVISGTFNGFIKRVEVGQYMPEIFDSFFGSIDLMLLTRALHRDIGGQVLGITDADIRVPGSVYDSTFGGKYGRRDIAIVSTKKLFPERLDLRQQYDLYLARILKVSLHEIGHNFGLRHHSWPQKSENDACPMSKIDYAGFGSRAYIRVVIDGRGFNLCENCTRVVRYAYSDRFT